MTDAKRKRIVHLGPQCWLKVFVLKWRKRRIRVSAEERSCLEGVYTGNGSEKSTSQGSVADS